MKWFKHDSDAHRNAKLRKLTIKYGMTGYGLYWYCLELITNDIKQSKVTFELEHDAEIIAEDTGINYQLVQEMMGYMINLGLFENSNGVITCLSLLKRLDQSMTSSAPLRKLLSSLKNHDEVMTNSDLVMQDKTRLDKTRQDKREKFIPPTLEQVKEYCSSRNNNIDPEKFFDYYQSIGWVRGRSKIKNWKACVHTWEKTEKEIHQKQSKPKSDHEWQALGQEKGIKAKPGEKMWDYISRVREVVYGH